jgi:flagellar protein FliO/FliZ
MRPPPQPSPAMRGRECILCIPSPACRGRLAWGRAVFGATLLLGSATALAQAPAPEGPSLLPLVLTLAFVLALIPVAVWMLKRLGAGNISSTAGMRVVAQLPIGQRERLVVVEAGDRWLILGVTPTTINRVGTLPKGELPAAGAAGGSFAALLMNARRGRDHG